MKEIKEEVQRTDVYVRYQATDGTIFPDREECEKYEKSARGVLISKVNKFKVGNEYNAWDLMGGYEDNTVVAFKLRSKADADTLMQFIFLEDSWLLEDRNKHRKEEIEKTINLAASNKDLVLFGINMEGDYYFINSRQNIIDNLHNLDKSI